MQLFALLVKIRAPHGFPSLKGLSYTLHERPFPFPHLRGMNVVLRCDLLRGFLSLERFQRHSGFECCVVSSAFGFHFRWSFQVVVFRSPLPSLFRAYPLVRFPGSTSVGELEAGVRQWIERYNTWRPHQTLGNQTPERVYETDRKPATPAAEMKKAA